VGSCEDDVEISGSIKDDEFLERLSAFQRGCALQLVKKYLRTSMSFRMHVGLNVNKYEK
jgi:hypothetical protein